MKEIVIRDLQLSDLDHDNPLWRVLANLSALGDISREAISNIYFERQHAGVRTLVASIEDEIIATGSIFIEHKYTHGGGKVAHIEDVVVLEDYQKGGIGRMLMNELISIAKLVHCYKVILNCSPKNVLFYTKLGFRKHEYGMRLDL